MPDIGRVRLPLEQVALRHRQRLPVLVAGEDRTVFLLEHLRTDRLADGLLNFLLARPDVLQVDWRAAGILPERLVEQVDVHPAGQCVGHHQRRRGQVVGSHLGMDPAFKVAVAAQHGSGHQLAGRDALGHRLRQGTGVADAVAHRDRAGHERTRAIHRQVEHRLLARRAPVQDAKGNRWQSLTGLLNAIAFCVVRLRASLQRSKPLPDSDLLEHLNGRRETATLPVQGFELAIFGLWKPVEAIVPLQKRVMREHGRLLLGQFRRRQGACLLE